MDNVLVVLVFIDLASKRMSGVVLYHTALPKITRGWKKKRQSAVRDLLGDLGVPKNDAPQHDIEDG